MKLFFQLVSLFVFIFYINSVWSNALPGAGLSCFVLYDWLEKEKKIVKKIFSDNRNKLITKYNFVTPKNIINKNTSNLCVYKSDSLNVSFKENEMVGGEINIHFSNRKHKGRLLSSQYIFYMFLENEFYKGKVASGKLEELFRFNLSYSLGSNSMIPLFKHSEYLYPRAYWVVAVFTYRNGETYLYALKTKPK